MLWCSHHEVNLTKHMKKSLVSALAISSLVSGCHHIYQIAGGPKHLNSAEAAVRYLEIVCPTNAVSDSMNKRIEMLGAELQGRKITLKEAGEKLDAIYAEWASTNAVASETFTDPDYVWPDSVKTLIAELSGADLEIASSIREFQGLGGFAAVAPGPGGAIKWPEKPHVQAEKLANQKASMIRAVLRLPPRSEGCKDGKSALTVEQMKQRQ